ncbi:MAG: acetylornithine/succinylornithine family transaminase [Acidimicrobiia bacterium]|nr:acetylornithine/succinylornithine family transaminase [Acidimicrobiia bacterium]
MTHSEAMGDGDGPCPLMANYGAPPVLFERGQGTELWDRDGRRYLDFLTGLAVVSLGHSHPVVAAAVAEQASKLQHTSNLFANEHQAPVARTLDALITGTPGPGPRHGQVLFQNSGAEANEAALKLARKYQGRGRHVVVSAFRSFHGRTLATLAATGQPEKHEPFQPLPEGFRHATWNDVDEFAAALDPTVGAILLEPLQGEGGVNPASPEFFAGIRSLCDDRGILLILDEVQCGLGRTGEWFGFQHFGIEPDIVTTAKALGNGMPVAAVWARADVAAAFKPGDHGSTFAGQPLALAAARATLEVMQEIDAPALARSTGAALADGLSTLARVNSVRGLGLLLAVELDRPVAKSVGAACLDAGLIVNALGDTSIRVAPPLNVSSAHVAEALAILGTALEES